MAFISGNYLMVITLSAPPPSCTCSPSPFSVFFCFFFLMLFLMRLVLSSRHFLPSLCQLRICQCFLLMVFFKEKSNAYIFSLCFIFQLVGLTDASGTYCLQSLFLLHSYVLKLSFSNYITLQITVVVSLFSPSNMSLPCLSFWSFHCD